MNLRDQCWNLHGDQRENLHSIRMEVFLLKNFEYLHGQIAILNSRGLIVPNYKRAKQYLLTNNYYNIINGYSKYFMNGQNTYIPGATFDEITHLYYFDKEIKYTLFRAITEAENHIKSILAYRFSEIYNNKPYAYLDINCYDNSKTLELGWLISRLTRIINNNKNSKNNNSIKHHVKKHNDVPIWVLIDYLDFGEMNALIKNLPVSVQNNIAKNSCSFVSDNISMTTPFTPETMISFTENIRQVRNICAHNNKLLDSKCKGDIKFYPDLHSLYGISRNSKRNDVYNVFISLQCFLSKTQYAQLHNTIRKRIITLDNRLNTINVNTILKSLGFPKDWHKKTPALKQN